MSSITAATGPNKLELGKESYKNDEQILSWKTYSQKYSQKNVTSKNVNIPEDLRKFFSIKSFSLFDHEKNKHETRLSMTKMRKYVVT